MVFDCEKLLAYETHILVFALQVVIFHVGQLDQPVNGFYGNLLLFYAGFLCLRCFAPFSEMQIL